ncbi:MAG: sporulation protein YqfD [Agathobacter sp.]|nr:sporulation protein YqfD [Agathobacter sp.]
MRHFWQWFCGYVCVCVKGRQVNRFLNLCSRNGIHLWRITYDMEQSLRANLRLRDFYDLKPYLRKTRTKLHIISKKGFPFWCYRHPRLKWFLSIGVCLLCVGLYSFGFIWNIEIIGNSKVSTQEIMECLQENQVDIGLKKDAIDCSGVENLLREQFHQLGWVSVYFEYTNLCVEVKESLYDTLENAREEDGKKYNYVANKDAEIVSIVTRAGKAVVQKGQFVKKGDVLVLGENEIFDDNGEIKEILYFKADALIYGDVVYEMVFPISEIEIAALNIVGRYNDDMLVHLGCQKLEYYLKQMETNDVVILKKFFSVEKEEKSICFRVKIYAREQIGINIPAEEVRENELE